MLETAFSSMEGGFSVRTFKVNGSTIRINKSFLIPFNSLPPHPTCNTYVYPRSSTFFPLRSPHFLPGIPRGTAVPFPHSFQSNDRPVSFPTGCGRTCRAVPRQFQAGPPYRESGRPIPTAVPHGPFPVCTNTGMSWLYLLSMRIILFSRKGVIRIEVITQPLQIPPVILKIKVDGL